MPRKGQLFCLGGGCKNAYHYYEKQNAMVVPECFRPSLLSIAEGQDKTLKEAIAMVVSIGLRWEEQGKTLSNEQVFEEQKPKREE